MPEAMLTLDGKRFVVLPEKEYRSLKAKATRATKPKRSSRDTRVAPSQESRDIAEAQRNLAHPRRIPASEVFRKLGV